MGANLFHLGRLPRSPYLHIEPHLRPLLDELVRISHVHAKRVSLLWTSRCCSRMLP